jgi:hypothetical protein
MGGLFNILNVRESLTSYDDPGWYNYPPGTVASLASASELRKDGIDSEVENAPSPQEEHKGHPS